MTAPPAARYALLLSDGSTSALCPARRIEVHAATLTWLHDRLIGAAS
jgi:hypothetical protein